MPGWDETEGQFRYRVREPEGYDSFSQSQVQNGVWFVYGWKAGKSEVQSVRFNKKIWTKERAKTWIKEHKKRLEASVELVAGVRLDVGAVVSGKKTLIISKEKSKYLGKKVCMIQDDKAYGSILLNREFGPYPTKWIRKELFDHHQIPTKKWNQMVGDTDQIYVIQFKVGDIFETPISVTVSADKWLESIVWKHISKDNIEKAKERWSISEKVLGALIEKVGTEELDGMFGKLLLQMEYDPIFITRELARPVRDKCMGYDEYECNEKPDVEILWAEGKAHAWFCNKCLEAWKKEEPGWHDVNILRKLRWGVASKRWKDGPPTTV